MIKILRYFLGGIGQVFLFWFSQAMSRAIISISNFPENLELIVFLVIFVPLSGMLSWLFFVFFNKNCVLV